MERCLCHCETDTGPLTNFTETSFKRFLEYRQQWLQLDGRQNDAACDSLRVISNEDETKSNVRNFQQYFYHRKCYSSFTNKTLLSRAQARSEKRKVEETTQKSSPPSSRRKLLRSSSTSKAISVHAKSQHVLPAVCIICKKKDSYFTDNVS